MWTRPSGSTRWWASSKQPDVGQPRRGLTDDQVDDVRAVIKAMQSPRISAAQVAGLRRVASLPTDHPARQAWMVRKQDVLDRIAASEGGGAAGPGT